MSAAAVARPGRPYDAGRRKQSTRPKGRPGVVVYIPAEVLADAGIAVTDPAPFYRLSGHRRSANAASVIVSLYREP